jgi:acetate kinase
MPTKPDADDAILTINAGSSSLKFAVFRLGDPLSRVLTGKFERVSLPGASMSVSELVTGQKTELKLKLPNHAACVAPLRKLLKQQKSISLRAISHRIVHGGARYRKPERVTARLIRDLHKLSPLAPEHLPQEIALLEEFGRHYPRVPQVACFDTAFHADMPRVAKLLPLPRCYEAKGVQRYGFHGLSYTYLMEELAKTGRGAANGRIILAHLGNGASMAAVRNGRSIDTTMAFTPAAGLVMSTRTGDLDPGLPGFLARTEKMTAAQFNAMVNARSGLLGVSETSSDVRDLMKRERNDKRAAEALELFCYQARKWIGALAATLNGLDTLVFAGGIGENSTEIRARICAGLEHLGVRLDGAKNRASGAVINRKGGKVTVRIIRTDEELLLARTARKFVSEEARRSRAKNR